MRRFAVGDIHGGNKGLVQVLERVNFDKENDMLISVGDIVDGWPDVPECFETLMSIKNLEYIWGNHDEWFMSFCDGTMAGTTSGEEWLQHGGKTTYDSYVGKDELKVKHHKFMVEKGSPYVLLDGKILLVHAGFDQDIPLAKHDSYTLRWDRMFWKFMMKENYNLAKEYDKVFIGHTPTINFKEKGEWIDKPIRKKNVWNIDTGAGFDGPLTIINIDTLEFAQSDPVWSLYPDDSGRNRFPYSFYQQFKKMI